MPHLRGSMPSGSPLHGKGFAGVQNPVPAVRQAALVLTVAAIVMVGTPTAIAGSLDRTEITPYRVWQSNRCYKPRPPNILISDALSFNLAVEAFNSYLADMKIYLECAGGEANEDYDAMKQVLEESLARIRQDALAELEATRNLIEQYRPLYAEPSVSAETPRPDDDR